MTDKEKSKEAESSDLDPAEQANAAEGNPAEMGLLLEDARAKADEHYSQLLRIQAELDNLRKRTSRELENAHKFALEKFMTELLPVRDSLELGLNAADTGENVDPAKLREGVDLTLKMLSGAMEKFGAAAVDPQGERFNPDLHQALSMQQAPDMEPNTVVAVVQKGYQLNDRLIRPAMVIVSTGGQKKSEGEAPDSVNAYGDDKSSSGGNIDDKA